MVQLNATLEGQAFCSCRMQANMKGGAHQCEHQGGVGMTPTLGGALLGCSSRGASLSVKGRGCSQPSAYTILCLLAGTTGVCVITGASV